MRRLAFTLILACGPATDPESTEPTTTTHSSTTTVPTTSSSSDTGISPDACDQHQDAAACNAAQGADSLARCVWFDVVTWFDGDPCPDLTQATGRCVDAHYVGEGCYIAEQCTPGRVYVRIVGIAWELGVHLGECGVEPLEWNQCDIDSGGFVCTCVCG